MAYCSKCGVEVESSRVNCPLCESPIHNYDDTPELSRLWPSQKMLPKKRIFILQSAAVIPTCLLLTIAFLILFVIDWRPDGKIDWSAYSLAAVGSVCAGLGGILIVGRNRFFTLGWLTLAVLGMQKLFQMISGGTWFEQTAVPITILAAALSMVSLFSWSLFGRRFRIQGTVHTILAMILCFGIDMIVVTGSQVLTWSVITAIPLGSAAVIGLFSLIILPKLIDFDKYFHS